MEGNHTPAPPVGQLQAGFLIGLPQQALIGGLVSFKLAADADPLVLIHIVFLLDPVEHQDLISTGDVAKGRIDHCIIHVPFPGTPECSYIRC